MIVPQSELQRLRVATNRVAWARPRTEGPGTAGALQSDARAWQVTDQQGSGTVSQSLAVALKRTSQLGAAAAWSSKPSRGYGDASSASLGIGVELLGRWVETLGSGMAMSGNAMAWRGQASQKRSMASQSDGSALDRTAWELPCTASRGLWTALTCGGKA